MMRSVIWRFSRRLYRIVYKCLTRNRGTYRSDRCKKKWCGTNAAIGIKCGKLDRWYESRRSFDGRSSKYGQRDNGERASTGAWRSSAGFRYRGNAFLLLSIISLSIFDIQKYRRCLSKGFGSALRFYSNGSNQILGLTKSTILSKNIVQICKQSCVLTLKYKNIVEICKQSSVSTVK